MVDGFLYSKNHKYAVLYTSKCGCTSIRFFFLEIHKDEVDQSKLVKFNKGDILDFFPLPPTLDLKSVPKFLVTRNPYLRAVSMYTNKFIEENSLIKERFSKKGVECSNNSFLAMLEAIKKIKDAGGSESLFAVSTHISEQSYSRKAKFPLDSAHVYIIQLENLEKGLVGFYEKYFPGSELLKKVKASVNDKNNCLKSNVTPRSAYYDGLDVAEMEFTDLKNIPNYQSFYYNKRCKELVDEIYDQDFRMYGYKKELPFK
jgi:hypothetical protein